MTPTLLHLVVASLRDDLAETERDDLAALAHALVSAEGVQATFAACSQHELITATWLRSADDLEAFASSAPHLRFVLEGVARRGTGMWSAAANVAAGPPPDPAGVGALWAFGLPADPPAFEWQVRDLLTAIEALPGQSAAGPTTEERERFRAAGVVLLPNEQRAEFDRALSEARSSWGEVGESLREASAPLLSS